MNTIDGWMDGWWFKLFVDYTFTLSVKLVRVMLGYGLCIPIARQAFLWHGWKLPLPYDMPLI